MQLDRYTLQARVKPAVIAGFPVALAISAWVPFDQWQAKLFGGGLLWGALSMALASAVRRRGQAIEKSLWEEGGGQPTMRMLRHRDDTFTKGSKARIHANLVRLNAVPRFPTPEEEHQNSLSADGIYSEAADWVRAHALAHKGNAPYDVVHAENINYGFARNSLGIKVPAIFICCASLAIVAAAFINEAKPYLEIAATLILLIYQSTWVSKKAFNSACRDYSHRALSAHVV